MIDSFQTVLEELGELIALPLHIDQDHRCVLNINGELDLFLRPDEAANTLIIACKLVQIHAGIYRQRVFKNALIANGVNERQNGYFAFSSKNQYLILNQTITLLDLKGEKLADLLEPFIQKALDWKRALDSGYDKP